MVKTTIAPKGVGDLDTAVDILANAEGWTWRVVRPSNERQPGVSVPKYFRPGPRIRGHKEGYKRVFCLVTGLVLEVSGEVVDLSEWSRAAARAGIDPDIASMLAQYSDTLAVVGTRWGNLTGWMRSHVAPLPVDLP